MLKRLLLVVLAVGIALLVGAYLWATRHGEIAAIEPPSPESFDPQLVETGEMLAGIGNCSSCHTAADGADFAGGYSTATPFGIVYSTNITPDPEQGIGTWSEEAFVRAMRQGVDREGNYLYPVFPYDHFTLVSDEDLRALYAFFMTREPAQAEARQNELGFPYNNRLLIAAWQLLFHENRRFEPDPDRSEAWNRGAYLAEGLGHCGACHTPRNRLGGLDRSARFEGAALERGWYAPAMDEGTPAVVPWTEDALVNYLLDGWDRDHGIADGPMTSVVDNLYTHLPEDDAYAMAEYILSFQPQGEVDREALRLEARGRSLTSAVLTEEEIARAAGDPVLASGQAIFARSCANCHREGADTVPLALTTAVNIPEAGNMLAVTRYGIKAPLGASSKAMPAFPALSREELGALARFVRWQFTDLPAWENTEEALDEVLAEAE